MNKIFSFLLGITLLLSMLYVPSATCKEGADGEVEARVDYFGGAKPPSSNRGAEKTNP